MGYYSIVFPSSASRERAEDCPWLSFRTQYIRCEYTTRGNKTLPVRGGRPVEGETVPQFFADTNLDQVLKHVFPEKDSGDIKRIFYMLSTDRETVRYRQEIVRALESPAVSALFHVFCRDIESALRTLTDSEKVHLDIQRDKYIVDGVTAYCNAVHQFLSDASGLEIPSCGLLDFVKAVRGYVENTGFEQAEETVGTAKKQIEDITFQLRVAKGEVIVACEPLEYDFNTETREIFALVDAEAAGDLNSGQAIHLFRPLDLCPLGALIAGGLQSLHPEAFRELRRATETALTLPAPFIRRFTQEIHFYFDYLDTVEELKSGGVPFCIPAISESGALNIRSACDFTLALKGESPVSNDLFLDTDERGILMTGANHSGKTTFIRTLGQIAVLASLGLPVPCEHAELPLFHMFFSHFSDAEESGADRGRLKGELLMLKSIRSQAGGGSLVLLNEMFSSTTAQDAQTMTEQVLNGLADAGACVLCVTHTPCGTPKRIVSMASQIASADGRRLYRIIRASAATRAYADELVLKHRLSYAEIKERIGHAV